MTANTTYATVFSAEVPKNCLDSNLPKYPGVWYSFVGTGDLLVARSCSRALSYISVFKGNCGATNLHCVAGTSDACDREPFLIDTVHGTTYVVLLQSYYEANVDLSIIASSSVEIPPASFSLTISNKRGQIQVSSQENESSEKFTPNYPPEVLILSPSDGAIYRDLQLIVFNASISDEEDGVNVCDSSCCCSSLEWVSNIDGFLGVGSVLNIYASDLTANTHAIKLTGSDRLGSKVVKTVKIYIYRSAPTSTPMEPPCGLFRRNIFCPLKFRGIFGRFMSNLLG